MDRENIKGTITTDEDFILSLSEGDYPLGDKTKRGLTYWEVKVCYPPTHSMTQLGVISDEKGEHIG